MTDPFTAWLVASIALSVAFLALAAVLWRRLARPVRHRASIHLTPKYEARRVREIRAARERFNQGQTA